MPGTAADLVRILKAEVGVHEGRNSDGSWNNDQKYSDELPGFDWSDGQPWCDTFCGWGFWKAGLTQDEAPRSASCDSSWAAWQKMGRTSEYPAVGAQVFFGVPGDMQHTGIVAKYDDTYIWTVEGNTNATGSYQGDGVYAKKHERRDPRVIGYGYPKFTHPIDSADPKWQDKPPAPSPGVKPWPVHGVDISHHQDGPIDWKGAAKAGVQWVFHKATEGTTFTDPNYTRRRVEAAKAGMPFGSYHFARPQVGDAPSEATRFLDVAKPAPGDMAPMLDLEDTGGLTRAQLTTWVRTFVDTVEKRTGVKPVVYTPFDLDDTCGCLLWVARYNNDNEPPTVPAPWKRWDIHQFSNGEYGVPHTVAGFGAVDLDTMRPGLTVEQLRIPARPKPDPQPQPTPEPPLEADFYVGEISGLWDADVDVWKQAIAAQVYAGATILLITETTRDGLMRQVCPDGWDFARLDDHPGESECTIMWKLSARVAAAAPYATVMADTQFHTESGHLRPKVTSVTMALRDLATGDVDLATAFHAPSGDTDAREQAHRETLAAIPEVWDQGRVEFPDAGRILGFDLNRDMRRDEVRQAWDEAYPMLQLVWNAVPLPDMGTHNKAVIDAVAAGKSRLQIVSARVLPTVKAPAGKTPFDHRSVLVGLARIPGAA